MKHKQGVRVRLAGEARPCLLWENHFFSLEGSRAKESFSITSESVAITDRSWRRGRYTNPRWMREIPQIGKQDTIMSRYDFLVDKMPDDPSDGMSRFEKRLASYHKKLAGARARKQRQRDILHCRLAAAATVLRTAAAEKSAR